MLARLMLAAALLLCLMAPATADEKQDPLAVCVTVPCLGSLCREVGGDEVSVTTFVGAAEDPHFLEAKPSHVRALADADLFIQVGLELEIGWVPVLLKQCRNARVQSGADGYLDASTAIVPLEVPTGPLDRSQGDVHAHGNPHYLLDPINGLRVAQLIRDRLCKLRPAQKKAFEDRFDNFKKRLGAKLVGAKLAEKYDIEKLCRLHEFNKLTLFLDKQKERDQLEGWIKQLAPHFGAKAVGDHKLYPYLAQRFGLELVDHLEPLPGIAPTTKHLQGVIDRMTRDKVRLILSAPYFDAKHAKFVSEKTGAVIASIGHQVGSLKQTDDYLALCDANVRALVEALK